MTYTVVLFYKYNVAVVSFSGCLSLFFSSLMYVRILSLKKKLARVLIEFNGITAAIWILLQLKVICWQSEGFEYQVT